MNFRTTVYLAIGLVFLGAAYFLTRKDAGEPQVEVEPKLTGPAAISREFIEDKLGEVAKVAIKTEDGEEWVFESSEPADAGSQPDWRMISPIDTKVTPWELQRFQSQFNTLGYDISYEPGDPGAVTAAQAGLEPPQAVVTLTDTDDKTVSIEIGDKAGNYETYVRLAGTDRICIGKSELGSLIKDSALDYRDPQIWRFEAKDATRLEIIDRTDAANAAIYVFTKPDGKWVLESPVAAKATDKVEKMAIALASLRMLKWVDDREDRLALYGLQPAPITVRTTVQKEVEIEDAVAEKPDDTEGESEPAGPKTKTETTVYELHLSTQSPIGEETKVYARVNDEKIAGTLMKSVADKFTPAMTEWRVMNLTSVDVTRATRIELDTGDGNATFVRPGEPWVFEGTGATAEQTAVKAILDTIASLEAVVFIEGADNIEQFGLDTPQAEIRLTVPSEEETERITIGAYTDEAAKRMVYVRRNESRSIAKVRVSDLQPLLRSPKEYRDRTVLSLTTGRVESISLSTENRFADGRIELGFERDGRAWKLAAPVSAELKAGRVEKLLGDIAGLSAIAIAADQSELTAFGLHAPAATIDVTYLPPKTYRIDKPKESGDDGKPTPVEPVEVQPPPVTVSLGVTEHDGKVYAKRSDRPAIYELDRAFYAPLFEEFRTDQVWTFDDKAVTEFSVRTGDQTHTFRKDQDRWLYATEPDLPLDTKKVDNLLLQIKDLRTPRYVSHGEATGDEYGLSAPAHEVTVTLNDATARRLSASERTCDGDPAKGRYGAIEGRPGVFLLAPTTLKRFEVVIADLEAK